MLEEELPEVGDDPERLNSSSGRGMGDAKCADRSSLIRTRDDREPSMDTPKKNDWKMPALESTLNIEGGHLDKWKELRRTRSKGAAADRP